MATNFNVNVRRMQENPTQSERTLNIFLKKFPGNNMLRSKLCFSLFEKCVISYYVRKRLIELTYIRFIRDLFDEKKKKKKEENC